MRTFIEWVFMEKLGESHSYSCALAVFGREDSEEIIQWSEKHIPESSLYHDPDGGMGREDEIHVTVLYGLHTNEIEPVADILKGTKPFEITLGKVSKFDNNSEYDVIKLDIESSKLHSLNSTLRQLDYTSKFDTYIPHCTIAYVKKGRGDDLIGNEDFSGKKVLINAITFSPAEGEKRKIPLATLQALQ